MNSLYLVLFLLEHNIVSIVFYLISEMVVVVIPTMFLVNTTGTNQFFDSNQQTVVDNIPLSLRLVTFQDSNQWPFLYEFKPLTSTSVPRNMCVACSIRSNTLEWLTDRWIDRQRKSDPFVILLLQVWQN